ncbi:hypothetical protein VNO78_19844 [Psophocarpus tetragonolobus]|uniref:Uncharacterized protein n=1 Tax=Psophocarpus tetragonolobus TaxID=3891 RepID=A0AAN9SC97_PSOTE
MTSLSCFNNHSSVPKIFSIHVPCVVAKDSEEVSNQNQIAFSISFSPNLSPQKIIKKIIKAINLGMCFKTKCQEKSSSISNKIKEKINKSMQHARNKIKLQKEEDRCLWKKTILIGQKCKPLEFSGVIFYDSEGNNLSEPPKSPRFAFSHSPTFSPRRGEIDM